jgi:MoaA/NifB/PqqE/SkfB family radical SAM enzyme
MDDPYRREPAPHTVSHTLQVHVTRRCNLRCLHCYSSSGPEARGELPLDVVNAAIDDAASLGYRLLAISGGEPMLYRPLAQVLGHARRRGLATAITTNGMLLDPRRLGPLREVLSYMAVSLDGRPEAHDRMRAHHGAFAAMAGHLGALRASGIPFGFLFTLTRDSIADLDWVADFAAASGAVALQIHPLSAVGRAATGAAAALPGMSAPDAALAVEAAHRAVAARRRHAGRLRVVIDYMPWLRLPNGDDNELPGARLADIVSPLVIEADGTVVPLAHDFSRVHALGTLHASRLSNLAEQWVASGGAARFQALVRRVADAAKAPTAAPLVSWADDMRRLAALDHRASRVVVDEKAA